VPQIFAVYKIDIESLLRHVFSLDHITFDHFLDQIMASKACKSSIKAGDVMSYEQMKHLITD
jgi:DNA mismatch repair ATPase MutL